MYCVKCGVKLADTEECCPLCGTVVYHPDITRQKGEDLYPKKKYPYKEKNSYWFQGLMTFACCLPMIIVLMCDFQFNAAITWSGYVIGAILVGYVSVILPMWFKRPNPVIFVPCDFAAVGLYLVYINLVTDGDWFLSFAFPVLGGIGAIVVTVVTLMRYVPKGKFFIFGGAFIALGGFMLLMEAMMCVTFEGVYFKGWSLYPLISLALLGGALIFLGICRPARESMERRFFI
jgi:hypothetical protein